MEEEEQQQEQHQNLALQTPAKRKSLGRQKIEIVKIKETKRRDVTFSKRRTGLFKKAAELAILCGTPIVAIVFSPAGRAYSFSHPSADAVIDCYLTGNPCQVLPLVHPPENNIDEQLRAAKEQNEELNQLRPLLDVPVDGLGLRDLEQFLAVLESVRADMLQKVQALRRQQQQRQMH